MTKGDSGMAIWNTDLTTEDGALGAAQMGGFACFFAAGLGVLSLVFMWGLLQNGTVMALAGLFALIEILVFVAAGFRLRAGKGTIWGSVAAAFLAFELVAKLAALAFSIGLVVNVILLAFVINGIR